MPAMGCQGEVKGWCGSSRSGTPARIVTGRVLRDAGRHFARAASGVVVGGSACETLPSAESLAVSLGRCRCQRRPSSARHRETGRTRLTPALGHGFCCARISLSPKEASPLSRIPGRGRSRCWHAGIGSTVRCRTTPLRVAGPAHATQPAGGLHGRGSVRSSEYKSTSWFRPSLKKAPRAVPSRAKPHLSAIRREAAFSGTITSWIRCCFLVANR